MSTSPAPDFGLLIIGYQRISNVMNLISTAEKAGVKNIYISVDGFRKGDTSGQQTHLQFREILRMRQLESQSNLLLNFNSENFGCALAVLFAIDWAFQHESNLVILEDDCLPAADFLNFCRAALVEMQKQAQVLVACGSQFFPINDSRWIVSRYPIFWGWCTTRENWYILKTEMLKSESDLNNFNQTIPLHEKKYWTSGSRRVREGFVDTWDTLLSERMIRNEYYALFCNESLITNIGNDSVATHTSTESPILNLATGSFARVPNSYEFLGLQDSRIRHEIYGIGLRHFFTTYVTRIIDYLTPKRRLREPLQKRIRSMPTELSQSP